MTPTVHRDTIFFCGPSFGNVVQDTNFWGQTANLGVDGSEIRRSPVDMEKIPLFSGLYIFQVLVWDFFQKYHCLTMMFLLPFL